MNDLNILRTELLKFIKRKFYSRPIISDCAEDIVNQAFLVVLQSPRYDEANINFGYMSVACLRIAYRLFSKEDSDNCVPLESCSELVSEDNFVEDIMHSEDTEAVLKSLETLKDIERIVVCERYFDGFSFKEISKHHNINLNTILSHHRRALEKLRPRLSKYFEN